MKRLLLLLLPFALLTTACNKDDDRNGNPNPNNPGTANYANPHLSGVNVTAHYRGRITNMAGNPIAGALVEVNGKYANTDALGFYKINNATTDRDYAVVKVTANGYFNQFRSFKPKPGVDNYADITLITKSFNGFFDAASGGEVVMASGAKVTFPANAIKDEQGNAYTGQVILATTYLDPTDDALPYYMPGSLAAVNAQGQNSGMITYGMVGVELLGSSGQTLNLANGSKATIEMPIQPDQAAHAPAEIPLWFFDEVGGIWREEGMAAKNGNVYAGEVGHFTFWNCDVAVNTVILSGTIVVEGGPAGSGLTVTLTRPNGQSATTSVGADGSFSGIVPANEALTLTVSTYQCIGVDLLEMAVDPLTANTELEPIEVELPGATAAVVSGIILDCDAAPMGGLNIVAGGAGLYGQYTTSAPDGSFTFAFACGAGQSVVFEIYDPAALSLLDTDPYALNTGANNLGNISFCEAEEAPNYFTYMEGDMSASYLNVVPLDTSTCYSILAFEFQGTNNSGYLSFEVPTTTGPVNACGESIGHFYGSLDASTWYTATFNTLNVVVTELQFDGAEIVMIKGSYTASVDVEISGPGGSSYSATATGTFKRTP